VGWDFCAALGMANALGINSAPVAEILPLIEAVMVRKITERMSGHEEADISS